MSDVDDYIEIELEPEDVQRTLDQVLESMSSIRREALQVKNVTEEQSEEYRHLVFRLASTIQGVVNTDETVNIIERVANHVIADERLMRYDPHQDTIFKKQNPEFIQDLEATLISLVGNNFFSTDHKHHILHAIKYLSTPDDMSEEARAELLETFRPYHGAIQLDTTKPHYVSSGKVTHVSSSIGKAFSQMLGGTWEILSIDETTVEARGDVDTVDTLAYNLHLHGFSELRLQVRNKDDLQGMPEHLTYSQGKTSLKKEKEKPTQRRIKIAKAMNNHIGYAIAGLLPKPIRRSMARYMKPVMSKKEFNQFQDESARTSRLDEGLLGLAAIAYGWIDTPLDSFLTHDASYIGIALVADTFLRNLMHDKNKGVSYGMLPLEIVLGYPAARIKSGNEAYSKGRIVCIDLEKEEYMVTDANNARPYLEQILTMEIPNLKSVLSSGSEMGESLLEDISNYMEGEVPQLKKLGGNITRDSNAVIFEHSTEINTYVKHSAVYCFKDRRYFVTAITDGQNVSAEEIGAILAKNEDPKNAITNIKNKFDTVYVHLQQYSGPEKVADIDILPT